MPSRTTVTFHLPHSSNEPTELDLKVPALAMAVVPRDAVSGLDEKWVKAIGVYVLIGPSDDDEHDYRAYVGQSGTGGLKGRLTTHRNSSTWESRHQLPKDWWKRALIVRNPTDEGFDSAEAGWLEGRLWDILDSTPKAKLVGKKGDDQTLPQYRRDQLEQYIQPITDVLRAIGASPDTPDQEPEPPPIKKRNATIADLIKAKLLAPGTRLRPISSQHETIAVVKADGQLEIDGALYDSPSGAAVAVVGHEMNGWTFWGAPSGEGTLVPLAELRSRLEPTAPGESEQPPPPEPPAQKGAGGLKPLFDAGLLEPGATVWASFRDRRYEATVDDDGFLHLADGSVHKNPSGAAVEITGHETNGWTFWRVDLGGETIRLKELRERAKAPEAG